MAAIDTPQAVPVIEPLLEPDPGRSRLRLSSLPNLAATAESERCGQSRENVASSLWVRLRPTGHKLELPRFSKGEASPTKFKQH